MTDVFGFETPPDRRPTRSLKWDHYPDPDVLPLWVADMDFPAAPAVQEALAARVAHGVYGYTLPPHELPEVIADRLFWLYGWEVNPGWLVWLPGLVVGLNVVCRAVGEAGDGVLTTTPIYPPFLSAPGLSGRCCQHAPVCRDETGRWVMDPDVLRASTDPSTRLFLFCNPHNPTGRAYTRPELEQVASFCLERDLILCSDEVHAELMLDEDGRHTPMAMLNDEIAARTITLLSPSKMFNLPGLGFAYAVVPDRALRRRMHAVMEGIVPYVNAFGYTAALAAYQHGEAWKAEVLSYLRGNRDLLEAAVDASETLSMAHVEATYLGWIDARRLREVAGMDGDDPARYYQSRGVGLSDGAHFGAPGYVRLNFACSRTLLQKALRRMGLAPAKG